MFEPLNGRDAGSLIVSMNLARRSLSKGQQAMALAMIYPDAEIGRPQKGKSLSLPKSERVMLSQARTILRHSGDLAQDVLVRGTHFDVALKQVREAEQNRRSHCPDGRLAGRGAADWSQYRSLAPRPSITPKTPAPGTPVALA
jgi:hypothetical protein